VRSRALWGGLAVALAVCVGVLLVVRPPASEDEGARVLAGRAQADAPAASLAAEFLAVADGGGEPEPLSGAHAADDGPSPAPEPASASGKPTLRLVDEGGAPWHGEGVQLVLLPVTDERPGLEGLPLAALDEVTWAAVRVPSDGALPLPVPPGRSVWAQLSSDQWRCAPLLVRHGEPAVAVMRRVTEVRGRILDAEGHPLAGAWLLLHAGDAGDLRKRWSLGNTGFDRREPTPPPDPEVIVSGEDGSFCMPHAAGVLAVQHHDAVPTLAWFGPDGGDVTLAEGRVIEGEIVGPDGAPPRGAGELVVKVSEGWMGKETARPYHHQFVAPDGAFRFRVRGLSAERAFAVLEEPGRTVLDSQTGIFDASGHAHVTLHYERAAAVVVRIPESHVQVDYVKLQCVEEPPPGRSSVDELMLNRSTDLDAWRGRVPWTGATDVVVAAEVAGIYVLARVVIDEGREVFDLVLPGSRLFVSVVAPPEAFPVNVTIRRPGTLIESGERLHDVDVGRSGEQAVLEHMPAGAYVLTASAAVAAPKALAGSVVAMGSVTVTTGADAHVVLRDDSQLIELLVVDEQGRPCEGVSVNVDSEVLPTGGIDGCLTDAAGRAHLRVAGTGPFYVYVYEQNPPHRNGGHVHGVRPEAGPFTFTLRRVAKVSFDIAPPRDGRSLPVRLRVTSDSGITGFDHDADLEEGRMLYPIRLPPGAWVTELLDADGAVSVRHSVQIHEPVDQTVRLDA
jgi:hypothetical protein